METNNTEDEKKSDSDEKPKLFIEAESGCEKRGHGHKNVYTRKEMEALRFVSAEEQSSKWLEVYCGLGPDVAREYDAMADFNTTQKQNYVNFDPRQRFQRNKPASAILGSKGYKIFGGVMETNNTVDEKKSNSDEKPKLFIEAESGCEKRGHGPKNVYTRKEMEALRFVSAEEQSSKWLEVYCGLGPDVARAYDAMADFNTTQKQNYVNFDPRQRFQRNKPASAVLGKEFYDNMDIQIHSTYGDGDLDGSTVSKEECSEEDDSSAGYNSILKPAFEVSGQPNFDSGPPQDGFEFIRRVRWEAEHIPNVTVAKVKRSKSKKEQTVYMPRIPDIAKCPEHLMPLKQWEDAFLADFSELSLALSHHIGSCAEVSGEHELIPDVHEEGCCYQLFDSLNQEKIDDSITDAVDENDASLCSSSEDGPILSAILAMDSVARASMLKKRINLLETMSSLSRGDCAWLFALCAAVDTPLDANTSAAIRSLLRKCASLRAEKCELDDEAVMLNILATISGRYFRQSEGFHT